LGFRHRDEISKLVNGALACAYLPIDEDSLGYVTMEAAEAGKPVLTLNDAGGLLQLIENDVTGIVCHPDVEAIASGLSRIADRRRAQRFGQALKQRWQTMNITWEHTLERLLA
jgi:glycosyltransferase involved in cell wall biosynthesis